MRLLSFLSFVAVAYAIEQPEGMFLRQKSLHEEYHRDMQSLNDFERQLAQGSRYLTDAQAALEQGTPVDNTAGLCGTRLSICEAVTQDIAVPAQKWISVLESMDGNRNDTLVDDLVKLITRSQTANFAPVVNVVHNSANAQNILTVIRDTAQEIRGVDQTEPTGALTVMVDALTRVETVLMNVGAPVPEQSIDLIVFLLYFTAGLLEVISGSPIEIIVYVLQQILIFVTTFLTGMFTVAVFPSASPECQSDLMLCNYMKMLYDVVPGLLGSILIADTPAAP